MTAVSDEAGRDAYLPFDAPLWQQYEHRIKWLMARIGMPDSVSLAEAMKQLLNDAEYIRTNRTPVAALSAAPVGGPLRRIVLDTLNAVAPAVENLSVHQEQCDRDGVMVKVSRQALDEVLNAVNEVAMQSAITASPDAPVAQEPVAYQYRVCIAGKWGDWTDLHQSVEDFRNGPWKSRLENGTCELRALYAGIPPATSADVGADEIARAIKRDLLKKNGNHGCLVQNSTHLDSFIIRGHVDLMSLGEAILALLSRAGDQK